ncbi:hypothetical protein CEQ90_09890 [Lewinellaceae bacterium SD302]|nr:hypothetical protein CEQ90_09890 [Lewinellaceae bacterium SD302]
MRNFYLLFLVLSISFTLVAQTDLSIDTIQVSSLRVPMKIQETGRNITVVTAEQIRTLPATSIDEVLQTVAGVEVQSRGAFGVQGDILMRGSTFTQVLILVDGMKMNDPLTGHFNSYIPVTLAEIERIEILRGAAAAMYGADAVGGVINIRTKTFSSSQREGVNLAGALNFGEHKLVNGYQGFSMRKGQMSLSGGASLTRSEGEFIPEMVIDTNTTLESYNNNFDLQTVGAAFGYEFANGLSVRARTAYDYRDFGARYFYTTSAFDKSTETVNTWWNQVQVQKLDNKSATDLNLAYKYGTDVFVFSPDFPSTNSHTTRFYNLTLNHLREINRELTLQAGLQADQREIESNDRGNHDDFHFGAYAMGVYRKDRLNLTASLRGDYDANYEFEFSPQLNVSYVLDRLVLRGSVGRSIRAADYTERFVSNNLMNLTPGRSLGNPDLLAERGWSEELGLDYTVIPGWTLKVTGFARQSSNLIDYVSTNEREIGSISQVGSLQADADYFFAQNITDVNTSGVELQSNLRQELGTDARLTWNLGLTSLSTSNEEDVISVYISSHADLLVTSQLMLNYRMLDLGISALHKSREGRIASGLNSELEDSYTLINSRLGLGITEGFGLNIQVQNLFDTEYQNILGARMPGRWFLAGVKWSL